MTPCVNVGRIPRMRRFTDRSGNNPYTLILELFFLLLNYLNLNYLCLFPFTLHETRFTGFLTSPGEVLDDGNQLNFDGLVKSRFCPFLSFPRRRESSYFNRFWIPAFAGMTVFRLFTTSSRFKQKTVLC